MKAFILSLFGLGGASCCLGEVLKAPPDSPDASRQYVFYLHGGIVTASDGRPVSREFGAYEYRAILGRFSDDGFVVMSEIRPDDGDPARYARRVAGWIAQLRKSGVPAAHISVVGASMGGVIAAHVSALLDERDLSFVILAGLYDDEPERSLVLHGRVLSIHDRTDAHSIVPESYFGRSKLSASRSIVTETGLGHGLIYTAHPAWYEATRDWIAGGAGGPAPARDATLEFCGFFTTPGEAWYSLTDTSDQGSSGWLKAGQSFRGYTVESFDRVREALRLSRDGRSLELRLREARVKEGRETISGVVTVGPGERIEGVRASLYLGEESVFPLREGVALHLTATRRPDGNMQYHSFFTVRAREGRETIEDAPDVLALPGQSFSMMVGDKGYEFKP